MLVNIGETSWRRKEITECTVTQELSIWIVKVKKASSLSWFEIGDFLRTRIELDGRSRGSCLVDSSSIINCFSVSQGDLTHCKGRSIYQVDYTSIVSKWVFEDCWSQLENAARTIDLTTFKCWVLLESGRGIR